jgi:hypothetical protein
VLTELMVQGAHELTLQGADELTCKVLAS